MISDTHSSTNRRVYTQESARMTAITLRSASGKWKLNTTIDDPLFTPILGAMAGEGMILPKTLTIEGALGEELERKWDCIVALREWMAWEKTLSNIVEKYVKDGKWHNTYYDGEVNAREYYDELHPLNTCRSIPPKRVVWRHELTVLSAALTLPDGWEAHTAVDERTPLTERVYHMEASLKYYRENNASRLRLLETIDIDVQWLRSEAGDYHTTVDMSKKYRPSLLDPYLRNTWLITRHISLDSALDTGIYFISQPIMLILTDWSSLYKLLLQAGGLVHNGKTFSIAKYMSGDTTTTINYGVCVGRTLDDGLLFPGYTVKDTESLPIIYSRLLRYLPEDVHPATLGLDAILRTSTVIRTPLSTDNYSTYTVRNLPMKYVVGLTYLVGWVNHSVITYKQWYLDQLRDVEGTVIIPRKDFTDVIEFLDETLGLYAMRRILLCILHYIANNEGTVTRKSKKKSSIEVEMVNTLERANLFANLLEKYLEQKNRDEGIRTLELGQMKQCKALRHYYD